MAKKFFIAIVVISLALISLIALTRYEKHTILQGEVMVKELHLSSKVPSRVEKLHVKEGQKVSKNDVLIVFSIPELESKAQVINADLNYARKTYNRMKNLYENGVIAQQKLDEARAAYSKAQGAYGGVASLLKENEIVSPVDGEIMTIMAEESELVNAGYPVINIANMSDIWVNFYIKEDMMSSIRIGDVLDVKIPALGDESHKFKIDYISTTGDFATYRATNAKDAFDVKSFKIQARPVAPIEGLRPGMSALFNLDKV